MILPKTEALLDLKHTIAAELFGAVSSPHEVLPFIKDFIIKLTRELDPKRFSEIKGGVFVSHSAEISDKATLIGPSVICENAKIRQGAFIRGGALIGAGAVIGNSSEIKNSIIFDGAELPHYNYVGDSVIGYKAHLGAGAVISNLKLDQTSVKIKSCGASIETGLRKFGAIVGDLSQIGCNSVVFPGSFIGRECIVYPLTSVRGILPERSILRNDGTVAKRE